MPNGGDDNCATCRFNGITEHDSFGYPKSRTQVITCKIRCVEISNLCYTYCVNHQGHNHELTEIPLGPIYRGHSSYVGDREPWQPSPDNEEIRQKLLEIARAMSEAAPLEHYGWPGRDEAVIFQLGEFGERRAVDDIRRVLAFNPLRKNEQGKTRTRAIMQAIVALAKIIGDEAAPDIQYCLQIPEHQYGQKKCADEDAEFFSAIRMSAIHACEYISFNVCDSLLRKAMEDPDNRNVELAMLVYDGKKQKV